LERGGARVLEHSGPEVESENTTTGGKRIDLAQPGTKEGSPESLPNYEKRGGQGTNLGKKTGIKLRPERVVLSKNYRVERQVGSQVKRKEEEDAPQQSKRTKDDQAISVRRFQKNDSNE